MSAQAETNVEGTGEASRLLCLLLSDDVFPLRSLLCTADLFMLRRCCKALWATVKHPVFTKRNAVRVAVGDGTSLPHVPLLSWCLANGAVSDDFWHQLGKTGDMDCIEACLAGQETSVLVTVFGGAASAGHEGVTLALAAKVSKGERRMLRNIVACKCIAQGGLTSVAQVVDGAQLRWDVWASVLADALSRGHLHFVQAVLYNVPPFADPTNGVAELVTVAATSGSLELVAWMVGVGWPLEDDTIAAAAGAGNVPLLDWLVAHDLAPNDYCMFAACHYGRLSSIRWLLRQGLQIRAPHLYEAAKSASPAVVNWLLDNGGVVYDSHRLAEYSCRNRRHPGVLQTLLDRNIVAPSPRWGTLACDAFDVAFLGDPVPRLYLHAAVLSSDLARVRYGLAKGIPVDVKALSASMRREECAILHALLQPAMDDGQLTDDGRAMVREALSIVGTVDVSIAETLAALHYHVEQ